jgi:hypothetical protein
VSNKHSDCFRGFTIHSQTWYGKCTHAHVPPSDRRQVEEIMIGMYHPDGGTSGEFGVRWLDIGTKLPEPRLEVFSDGWSALVTQFGDLLARLARLDGESIQPDEFAAMLRELGIIDRTERVRPPSTPADIEYASWSCA